MINHFFFLGGGKKGDKSGSKDHLFVRRSIKILLGVTKNERDENYTCAWLKERFYVLCNSSSSTKVDRTSVSFLSNKLPSLNDFF